MSLPPPSSPLRLISPLADGDAFSSSCAVRLAIALDEPALFAFSNDAHALDWAASRTHPHLVRRLAESAQRLFSSELARRLAARQGSFPLAIHWGRIRDVVAEDVAILTLPSEARTVAPEAAVSVATSSDVCRTRLQGKTPAP